MSVKRTSVCAQKHSFPFLRRRQCMSLNSALVFVGQHSETLVKRTRPSRVRSQEEVAAAQVEQQIRAQHLDSVTAPHDSEAAAKPGTTLGEILPAPINTTIQVEPHGNGVTAADVDGIESHLDVRMQTRGTTKTMSNSRSRPLLCSTDAQFDAR